jgi:N-hydroxyarylamine O-acetyltransferase
MSAARPVPLEEVLARLGLDAPPSPDLAGLAAVHRAVLLSVPFENLDIVLGRGVRIDAEAIIDKLVRRRRGGYCFECNLLLRDTLAALGFDTRMLLARVILAQPPELPARTHAAVLVELDGDAYVLDAGFGGPTPRHPVPLAGRAPGATSPAAADPGAGGAHWRTIPDPEHGWRMQRVPGDGPPQDLYLFDDAAVHASDLAIGNHWTSTHPDCHFTRRPIACRHTPTGRISIGSDRWRTFDEDAVREARVADAAELARVVRDVLDIPLAATDDEFAGLLALAQAASGTAS